MIFYFSLVAFCTAFLFAYINVFNDKGFSNYFFLIWRHGMVFFYCAIYGAMGILLFLTLKETAITIDNNFTNSAGSFFKAFVVGFTTKGIVDIRLFDIKHQGESFPIGLRTITHFLDTRFNKEFDSICLDRMINFMKTYRDKYENTNLDLFKKQVLDILSSHPATRKARAFRPLVSKAQSAKEILNAILIEFGRRTLNTINSCVSA